MYSETPLLWAILQLEASLLVYFQGWFQWFVHLCYWWGSRKCPDSRGVLIREKFRCVILHVHVHVHVLCYPTCTVVILHVYAGFHTGVWEQRIPPQDWVSPPQEIEIDLGNIIM